MITRKLLFDGEEMKFLTAKDLNILREIFLMGQMSKSLAIGYDFSSSPGFPIKVLGKGGQSTPGGCNSFVTLLVRRENAWHIILGDNPAGHGFVLRDLV